MFVIHTREGHRPDLSDCPPAKLTRGGKTFIGTDSPMGRILVRGEKGHDIIHQLYPIAGEPIIDKPGKGSFHATDLHQILLDRGIKTLIVCGVTLEVCVHTTVREANDRGYECVVLVGLRRVLLPGVPACGPRDDQGARRDLRLGVERDRLHRRRLPDPPVPRRHCRGSGRSIDCESPRTGVVHSAFERAVNLLLGGDLWTVLGAATGTMPPVRHSALPVRCTVRCAGCGSRPGRVDRDTWASDADPRLPDRIALGAHALRATGDGPRRPARHLEHAARSGPGANRRHGRRR